MGVVFYANPSPIFQPAMRLIENITNALNAVITTTFDHDYITGAIVRIYVPKGFGMLQINKMKGTITVLSPTTFSIDIDTTLFDIFVASFPLDPFYPQVPLVVPVGEINSTLSSSVVNTL